MAVSPGTLAVPGVLSAADIAATAGWIADWQLPSGLIPWFPGGHADPWNHVEAAMALATAGLRDRAEAAYQWLADHQRPDGAWHQYYWADRVKDPKLDTNVCAYVATGVWHHWLLYRDRGFLEAMWPVVERAVDFVLELQTPRGEIIWARHADGTPWSFALLTGCSSTYHSLRCAVALAETVGSERPDWELSAARLRRVIRDVPGAFAPKDRWAMDWYYPVLCHAVEGEAARRRLVDGWDRFVIEGRGVRCVSDRPWVTAAETCECVVAHAVAGDTGRAGDLFRWAQGLRCDDGSYHTGIVLPQEVHFPGGERTTYTGAAVILAADVLTGATPGAGALDGTTLPEVIDADDPVGEPPTGPR